VGAHQAGKKEVYMQIIGITRQKRIENGQHPGVEPWQENWLLHGEETEGPNRFSFLTWSDKDRLQTWAFIKGKAINDWIEEHPGTRPFAWWLYDAPREPVKGFDPDTYREAQRRRIGGIGTCEHDLHGGTLDFEKGIPRYFAFPSEAKGEARVKAYNEKNPPQYESEAAYLQRHELLTPAEIKWLEKHPEALDPVVAEQHGQDIE
jgi:hypothetical protein